MAPVDCRPTLKEVRQAHGQTLRQVAAGSHLHLMTIWRIEQGRVAPTPSTRWWVAQALGCQPDQINWQPATP